MSELNEKDNINQEELVTSIRISDDVVATIAAIAAGEIEGVGGMCGSFAGNMIERLGKKNSAKGVKVGIEGGNVSISMNILCTFGCKINDVCAEVQDAVKAAVEGMTGLNVVEVSIVVQGIINPAKEAEIEEEE